VTVHDISGDESEDETLLDEVEGGGGDHAAAAEDASAALLATITEQEGLVLTGGDRFKTIKMPQKIILKLRRNLLSE
jgi:hypothetical protein